MALASYTDLLASMAGWLNREDLTARLPDFVSLAEADFNRQLRVGKMIKRSTATLPAGEYRILLPTDWLEMVNIQAGARKIEYLAATDMDDARVAYTAGALSTGYAPLYYNLVGTEIELVPVSTTDVTLEQIYYSSVPPLASNATNWLLTDAPDAYLYGSLLHAAPYLDDDARVAIWMGGYQRAMDGLNAADQRAKTSGGPLIRRFSSF